MIKQTELSDPKSCLNKAARDEPLFVMRANDPRAPMAVRHWVTMSVNEQPQKKLDEALEIADKMEKWHNQHRPEAALDRDMSVLGPERRPTKPAGNDDADNHGGYGHG